MLGVTGKSCFTLFPVINVSRDSSNPIMPRVSEAIFPLLQTIGVQGKDMYDSSSNSFLFLICFSANHWRLLSLIIDAQDHHCCHHHHHHCFHCEGAGWPHCSRSGSKRWPRSIWGRSWLRNSGDSHPRAATDAQTLLWGCPTESHRLAPDSHWNHSREALPQRDPR